MTRVSGSPGAQPRQRFAPDLDDPGIHPLVEAVQLAAGPEPFDLAIVLGSGLGAVASQVEAATSFPYGDFSCFPPATVAGHAGRLIAGRRCGWRVLLFQGRFHLYEGHDAWQVSLPVRLAHRLGCRRLLLTNAAGGIRSEFAPGDFMFITDHLNLLGANPLRGLAADTFLDLTRTYCCQLLSPLRQFAQRQGIALHQGVIAALPGPSYETPAEIRMLRLLGADAVSMSTVPEAIMGRFLGMQVAGLSLIANAAAGLTPRLLTHQEVLDTGERSVQQLNALVDGLISIWQSDALPETAENSF
ncbi:MAG: purine-nucleoside phosphorylase [Desulfuromonadales bacterium]|nr:purine-nucleoside phosphorylase [Desulfuromonadales bacterium]